MNQLFNPFISLPLLKEYILGPRRIHRLKPKQLKKYQDKSFKKIVKYAYKVPLYHDKYKKAGIHPNDIHGIEDIVKLPFITKKDLIEGFPNNIVPVDYNKEKGFVICTGGTTGKPVSIYTDFLTIGLSSILQIRELKFFDLHWRKSRFAHIGNFNQYRIDKIAQENFTSHLESIISFKNRLNIDVNTQMIDLIDQLNKFRPDIIMTYPAIFQHLSFLKRKGYGKNIKPKILWTGGAILDDYTRRYVEDVFKCRLLNVYPSVEAGADIAFECPNGNWHINADFFKIESVDENGNRVLPGERGKVVLTRLYGRGTPIIRYTGMDDWLRLYPSKRCNCGLETTEIISGVEGRVRANIILPNGKIYPPGAFCFIEPVLHRLKTFKVRRYQIVQKKIDEIDILIVIDDDLRDVGPSDDVIFEAIKQAYLDKVGSNVSVNVKEVREIKKDIDSSKPPPIVVSHVTLEEGFDILSK